MKRKYVSDFVGIEDVKKLERDKDYLIKAGCGVGKSTFVKKVVLKYCLKNDLNLLYLTNRSNAKEKTKMEFEKVIGNHKNKNNIKISTYQAYNNIDFDDFQIIVLDECQYMITEGWNKVATELKDILQDTLATRIHMSGTPELWMDMFNMDKEEWEILFDEDDHKGIDKLTINKVYQCNNDVQLLNEIKVNQLQGNKTLVMCGDKEKAYKYSSLFEDSAFVCSQYDKKGYKKFIDKETISMLNENEKLNKTVVFSTSTIQTAININDSDYNLLGITDYFYKDDIIQIANRKRKELDTDKLDIIVSELNKKSLARKLDWSRYYNNILQFVYYDDEENIINLLLQTRKNKKYIPRCLSVLNDGTIVLDYAQIEYEKAELEWLEEIERKGYTKAIADLFNAELVMIDSNRLKLELIEKFMDRRLFDKDQKELEKLLRAYYGYDERTFGKKKANAFLEYKGIPFRLISRRKTINGNKVTFWELIETE